MKTSKILKASLVAAAASAACLAHAGGTFQQGYAFTSSTDPQSTGIWPEWELTADGTGYMWGVTTRGGTSNGGAIFKTNNAGVATHVYTFGSSGSSAGAWPSGPLLHSGANFYGVATSGGTGGHGVLYYWNTSSAYHVAHSFTGTDGSAPSGPLLLATDGNIYGTTQNGGACGQGEVFKLVPSTLALSVVHSFCGQEGASPITGVIQATDGALYGTAYTGGDYGKGTLFKLTLAGAFTRLRVFGQTVLDPAYPSRLVQGRNGLLYGTSMRGGYNTDVASQPGTIYSATLAGVLASNTSLEFVPAANPTWRAALNERFTGIFYGVSNGSDEGHVFQFRASNNTVTNIFSFSTLGYAHGYPQGGLTLGADGNLWGTESDGELGGPYSAGHLYEIVGLTANP